MEQVHDRNEVPYVKALLAAEAGPLDELQGAQDTIWQPVYPDSVS